MSATKVSVEDVPAPRKVALEDGKLEDQLTNDKLQKLQKIFEEADEDGGGGLDMDEFRLAMRQTMGSNVSDQEMDRIFMKVDTNCDGTVDWDEYLTYMLLECREKDQMQEQARQPFPRYLTNVDSEHRDSIIAVRFLPWVTPRHGEDWTKTGRIEQSKGKYVSVGRDGIISVWTMNMKQTACHRVDPPLANTAKSDQSPTSVWITDVAYLARGRVLVLGTTARILLFYHVGRNSFYQIGRVTGLDACPVSLTAFNEFDNKTGMHAVLLCGDDRGGISGIVFHRPPASTAINSRLSKNSRERLSFAEILAGRIDNLSGFYHMDIHDSSVGISQIMYCGPLECIISCSKDTETAMFLGDLKQRTSKSYFKVYRGINAFAYIKDLNVIVTGGYDAIVRVWNPYVPTKPSGMLRGHLSPILQVHVEPYNEHIISIAENKEIRVHDLNSQTCIQTFFRKMVPGLGERIVTSSVFQIGRHALILATNKLAWLEHQKQDMSSYKVFTSHSKPVTCVLYNPLFNQVVSADTDSTVSVWTLNTGEKVMQFKAHTCWVQGELVSTEITAISFDHTYRRLLTGAGDGTVKVWNFNNGDCLRELTVFQPGLEVTSIVCSKLNIITAGWNKQVTIYKDKSEDDSETYFLNPKHQEDILTVSLYPPALVASGSYDGQIMVYSMETKSLILKAEVKGRKLYPAHSPNVQKKTATADNDQIGDGQENVLPVTGPQQTSTSSGDSKEASCSEGSYQVDDMSEKIDSTRSSAVEKVLFLPSREHSKDTASLFCACADGYIRAWSAHPDGEMKCEFQAARKAGEAVCAMASSCGDRYLVSGDELGYIRVWDVSHCCIRGQSCSLETHEQCLPEWEKFTFYQWHAHLETLGLVNEDTYPRALPGATVGAHLVSSFRAHLHHIGALDVASPRDSDCTFILSAGPDRSVRLWRLWGDFVGIFGQDSLWDSPAFLPPPDRDQIYHARMRHDVLIPADIRRVASSVTLKVLFGGRPNLWTSTRGIFKWLACYPSRKEDERKDISEASKHRISMSEPPSRGTLETSTILGSSYKKTARHRPLPELNKPTISGPQCSAYTSLPCMDVDMSIRIPDIYSIHDIQARYKLPPIKGAPQRMPLKQRVRQAFRKMEVVAGMVAAFKGSSGGGGSGGGGYGTVGHRLPSIPIITSTRRGSVVASSYGRVGMQSKRRFSILQQQQPQQQHTHLGVAAADPGRTIGRTSILLPPVSSTKKSSLVSDNTISGRGPKSLQPIEEL